jgi:hypothetical protein
MSRICHVRGKGPVVGTVEIAITIGRIMDTLQKALILLIL